LMSKPLRVCLVSAAYRPYPSGLSEHVHNLARHLIKLGQNVEILTTRFPGPDTSPPPVPVTRIGRSILIPLNHSYATLPVGLSLPIQVKTFLKNRCFDIIHCHGFFWPELSYWAIRFSSAVNIITTLTAGFRLHNRGSRLFQFLFRNQIARVHGRIAISQRARAALMPYLPGEYRIIPSGVDLDRFHPGVQPYRSREPDRPTILFLGRLDKRKGLDILLRALPLVLNSLPQARLVVIGNGPMAQPCKRLSEKLNISRAVEFIGKVAVEEIPRWYASCDLFCSPALGGETQGVVLLEAMASGVPVVASDIPGYDETIRPEITGLLVPPGRPDLLADNILRVLKNPELRDQLVAGGLERVREFAWPLIARRTLDYYHELLAACAKTWVRA
ncbi:MAG: glycosyltransferase family 4 protein, partial [candidate division WOR-3 bacterium]